MSAVQAVNEIGNRNAIWRGVFGDLSALGVTDYRTLDAIVTQLQAAAAGQSVILGALNAANLALAGTPPAVSVGPALTGLANAVTLCQNRTAQLATSLGTVTVQPVTADLQAFDTLVDNITTSVNGANVDLNGASPALDLSTACGIYTAATPGILASLETAANNIDSAAAGNIQSDAGVLAAQTGTAVTEAGAAFTLFDASAPTTSTVRGRIAEIDALGDAWRNGGGAAGAYGPLTLGGPAYLASIDGVARTVGNYPAEVPPGLASQSLRDVVSYLNTLNV